MNKEFKPYYAVIFTSKKTEVDDGYAEMAESMVALAKNQRGFLGVESARNEIGITISYWENLNAIAQWKAHAEHQLAQQKGIKEWYAWYKVRICKVEREYSFEKLTI